MAESSTQIRSAIPRDRYGLLFAAAYLLVVIVFVVFMLTDRGYGGASISFHMLVLFAITIFPYGFVLGIPLLCLLWLDMFYMIPVHIIRMLQIGIGGLLVAGFIILNIKFYYQLGKKLTQRLSRG